MPDPTLPDAGTIRKRISTDTQNRLAGLDVFQEIESTNDFLMGESAPQPGRFRIALANHQTAGRGRFDNKWISPAGSGICLSLAFTFARLPEHLTALTLAIGQAAIQALSRFNVADVMLKWPNDLMAKDRKLAGILTELRTGERATVVIGLGLNLDLSGAESSGARTLTTAIDLRELGAVGLEREALIAAIVDGMVGCLAEFEIDGFNRWYRLWPKTDWLIGREVLVENAGGTIKGLATGVDVDGALLLRTVDARLRVVSGSVSVLNDGKSTQ